MGFTLCGNLLGLEVLTGETIANLFGGGFEFLTSDGTKICPVEDLVYCVWAARGDRNSLQLELYYLSKCGYARDHLVVETYFPELPLRKSTLKCSTQTTIIPPLFKRYGDPTAAEVTEAARRDHKYIINSMIYVCDGNPAINCVTSHSCVDKPKIDFLHEKEATLVTFRQDTMDEWLDKMDLQLRKQV